MRRSSCPEWERKKDYVTRSLFDDFPTLSPVQEEDYSPIQPVKRYSPLPPLIIEKEPNRHDEPEEFYQELEIKMHKLYRRLFLNDDSISLDDVEELSRYFATDYDYIYDGNKESTNIYKPSTNKEKQIKIYPTAPISSYNLIKDESKTNKDSKYDSKVDTDDKETLSENTGDDFRLITCKADVHQEASDQEHSEDPENFSLLYDDEKSNRSKSPILESNWWNRTVRKNQCNGSEKKERGHQSNGCGKDTESNTEVIDLDTTEDVDDNASIELVRAQSNRRQSIGSIDLSEYVSHDSTGPDNSAIRNITRVHSFDEHSLNVETGIRNLKSIDNEANSKSSESYLNLLISPPSDFKNGNKRSSSSTTKHPNETSDSCALNLAMRRSSFTTLTNEENGSIESFNVSMGFTLRSAEMERIGVTSTPKTDKNERQHKKQKKRKLQQVNWKDVQGDFFVGTPKVFKLCSCKDHVCNDST